MWGGSSVFTGIVEEVGRLRSLRIGAKSAEVEIDAGVVLEGTHVGDSILTSGVCLTVTALSGRGFRADAMPETVRRTTLAALRPGAPLNLERALSFAARLGGHLVTGHVDGVGTVEAVEAEDTALVVIIAAPPAVRRLTVAQGSLAVDGVSLTVVRTHAASVTVSLIPHTAAVTTLGALARGTAVNLEADLIGRYVMTYLERAAEDTRGAQSLTWDKLAEAGFA